MTVHRRSDGGAAHRALLLDGRVELAPGLEPGPLDGWCDEEAVPDGRYQLRLYAPPRDYMGQTIGGPESSQCTRLNISVLSVIAPGTGQ